MSHVGQRHRAPREGWDLALSCHYPERPGMGSGHHRLLPGLHPAEIGRHDSGAGWPFGRVPETRLWAPGPHSPSCCSANGAPLGGRRAGRWASGPRAAHSPLALRGRPWQPLPRSPPGSFRGHPCCWGEHTALLGWPVVTLGMEDRQTLTCWQPCSLSVRLRAERRLRNVLRGSECQDAVTPC